MRVNALVLAAALSLACIASGVAAPKPAPPSGAYTPKKAKLRPAEDRIEQAVNRLIKKADEFWHAGDYEAAGSQYYVITDLDPEYVEAMGFAWLAQRTMDGLAGNLPSVTGATGPRILGAIHLA